jgi:hypothetical protein
VDKIISPPTDEVKKCCDLLDCFIHNILKARETFPFLGQYEAPLESLNLMYLMIRNIDSIILLARYDLVLLPSAMQLTRNVFEMAMNVLWMLAPKEEFEREVRWLAQLYTEEEYYDKFSRHLRCINQDDSLAIKHRDFISTFRKEVTNVLPKPHEPLHRMPNLADRMKAINEQQKYGTYMLLSQYSHGTHIATGTYRRGLGNNKEFGEYITPKDWGLVFSICWYCLARTGERIFEVLGSKVDTFLSNDFIKEIETLINRIKTS